MYKNICKSISSDGWIYKYDITFFLAWEGGLLPYASFIRRRGFVSSRLARLFADSRKSFFASSDTLLSYEQSVVD